MTNGYIDEEIMQAIEFLQLAALFLILFEVGSNPWTSVMIAAGCVVVAGGIVARHIWGELAREVVGA